MKDRCQYCGSPRVRYEVYPTITMVEEAPEIQLWLWVNFLRAPQTTEENNIYRFILKRYNKKA